jgi:predicted dehydrogenase
LTQGRQKPRVLVIGAGLMGRHHARAAGAAGGSIAGIVDADLDAATGLAAEWAEAAVSTELEPLLKSASFDVAHVCTPPATHLDIAGVLARSGIHALIEKPLGRTADEARAIHKQFGLSNRLACPTHQYAFQRSVRSAIAALPGLGGLRHVDFDICSAGADDGRIAPDDLVAEILPHPLSIVQRLLPGDIAGLVWSCVRASAGEWLVAASIEGALLTISLSAHGRPTRFLSRITADQGSVEIDHFHDFSVVLPGRVSKAQKVVAPFRRSAQEFAAAAGNLFARAARREFAYPGLRTLVGQFYGAARNPGSPPPIIPDQSIAVSVARDRIIELASHA